jgi:hypothetical protein
VVAPAIKVELLQVTAAAMAEHQQHGMVAVALEGMQEMAELVDIFL